MRTLRLSWFALGAVAFGVAFAPGAARGTEPVAASPTPPPPPPPPPLFPNPNPSPSPTPNPGPNPSPTPGPNPVLSADPTSSRVGSPNGSTPLWTLHWHEADEPEARILDPDAPPRAGYKLERRPRRTVVNAGIGVLASSYGLSVTFAGLCAVFSCKATSRGTALLVPIAGPWIQIAQTSSATGNVVLASDALGQLTGVAMITLGYVFRQDTFVPEGFLSRLTVTPVLGGGRTGMGVAGAF